MDGSQETIAAGEFKHRCLALIDHVAATGASIIISKYGKPVARLTPVESPEQTEQRILAALRSGDGGMLVDEATFLAPTSEITGHTVRSSSQSRAASMPKPGASPGTRQPSRIAGVPGT